MRLNVMGLPMGELRANFSCKAFYVMLYRVLPSQIPMVRIIGWMAIILHHHDPFSTLGCFVVTRTLKDLNKKGFSDMLIIAREKLKSGSNQDH